MILTIYELVTRDLESYHSPCSQEFILSRLILKKIYELFLCGGMKRLKVMNMLKQCRGTFFKNDKLTNLKLMVFLILHRSWAIVQKSVKNNWN